MDAIPHDRNLTGCAMTAENIAQALGERRSGRGCLPNALHGSTERRWYGPDDAG